MIVVAKFEQVISVTGYLFQISLLWLFITWLFEVVTANLRAIHV